MGPNFAIALDLLNMGDADPQLRETVQELSRIHRLPLEQYWIEALIKFGVDPERAKNIVWMSYALYRGLAMRALILEDPEHNAQVMSEWRIIAHQQIASAEK